MRSSLRKWLVIVCLAALVAVGLAHRSILPVLAAGLIVDERPVGDCTHIVLFGGDSRYDVAAELVNEDPNRKVVHLGSRQSRLVEFGVLPPGEGRFQEQLQRRGVPAAAIELRGAKLDESWAPIVELNRWLDEHPSAVVIVLCDRFRSGRLRFQLDNVLSPDDSLRVSVRPLPDRRYNESNWWRSRRGVKEFLYASLDYATTRYYGREGAAAELPEWDPDEYERLLRQMSS